MFKDQQRATDPDEATMDDSMIADEGIVLTASLLDRRTRMCLPEIDLVAAIFEDALRCVERARSGVTHEESSEAFDWIASERQDWPFAFVNVCDFLGMDATLVRKRLRIREEAHGGPVSITLSPDGGRPS